MQGRIVRAPEVWNKEQDNRKGLFLAGGITGCPQWQAPLADRLAHSISAVIVDPRRDNWNMETNHVESVLQIVWEAKHLKKCDHILFWFSGASICPITLLELGKYLDQKVQISVGTDPDYSRRLDVEVQVSLVRPELPLWSNLDRMAENLIMQWQN